MSVIYSKNENPFNEVTYIERYQQLIVKRIHPEDNEKYTCNFHFQSNRGTIKTIVNKGMDFLFDIEQGVYNITLKGSNKEDFSIVFEKLTNEGIEGVDIKNINFSIEP